jgi:serine phosphatase RsbU (regulator of sigma subunit)
VTALIGRWRAATSTFRWVNCGHPPAYLVGADGVLHELEAPAHRALGKGAKKVSFEPAERRLESGERLILLTDGILDRQVEGGGTFGVDGLRRALEQADTGTAASTAMAIQDAVTSCWKEPLQDDATIVVMCVA